MVLCKMLHLLVRDVSNRRQRYEKVFKSPKNYGLIFKKQTKLLILVKLGCFLKCDKNVERKIWLPLPFLLITSTLCSPIHLLPRDEDNSK